MPRVSKKRKAAMLRCIRRKETTEEIVLDEIRSGTSPTNIAEWEIEQPLGKIEDPYMDFDAVPGFASIDCSPASGVSMPSAEDSIVPSELFDAQASSVAQLKIEDFNAFPLPDIPFDPMFDYWAENYGSDVRRESSTVSRPLAWKSEETPPAPSHTPRTNDPPADTEINRSNTLDEVGHFLSIRNTTISTEFRFGTAPLSPLLADTSADLEGECSEPIRTDCALGENADDGPVDQWPSSERHLVPSSSVEKLSFDDSIEIDCCHQNLDIRCEERLVEDQTAKPRINLTRSKVMIIDIPGKPPGAHGYDQLDCYCDACIKCCEFKKQIPAASEKKTSKSDTQDDKTTEAKMREIYHKFDEIELPTGTYDHSQAFVKTTTENRRKSVVTTRGCQAANADEFAQLDIPKWKRLCGRRIIDYDYFLKWVVTAQAVHSRYCLGVLCPYQEDVKSMQSTLWLMCNVCGIIVKGSSEEPSRGTRLRYCTSWAVLNTGSTYTMAQEFFAFLDIPFMNHDTFSKDESAMDNVLESALQDSLDKAVQEEVQLASQELVDKQLPEDAPLNLCCELDGSWGLRSNGHRFSSASGCAAMIGTRSKKVVYIATRNKRCSACNHSAKRRKLDKKITPHKCYKNYTGSSGGMESDIVIEGFEKLYQKGVKFTTVVTDGDSTTVSKLKNSCVYGHEIQHQLCCNHITKNAGKKLREIKVPKQYVEHVSKRYERITKGVRSAIKHCADEGSQDVEGLRHDIRNVPNHVFGEHSACRDYFCQHKNEPNDTPSIIEDLRRCGVWDKIVVIMEKLASKAEFLCENKTSNLAENLFCRLCKYNVGKRVDTMSRGSYQRRVQITALMCNEGYAWHEVYMKVFTGESPGFWTRKMFEQKSKSLERSRRARKNPNFTRRSKTAQLEKETDYGEAAVEEAENAAREHVVVDVDNMRLKYQLNESTKKKLKSCLTITEMEELAKGRILSKFIPEVVNSREASKLKKSETLLQTTTTWNFLKMNRAVVGLILRLLKEEHAMVFEESKMFIDPCHEFLCTVPDAVSKDGATILLVKKKESNGDIKEQASSPKGVLGCKIKGGIITLDRSTTMEVQAAIHISSSAQCLVFFMLGTNVSNHLMKIVDKDEEFFETKIEPKLNIFFNDYFLKKLVEKQISVKQ